MIFVSIASYRDDELIRTIESIINNADNPDQLSIGIVNQCTRGEKPDLSKYSQVSEIWLRAQEAKGAGYARHLAQTLYKNEDFFLQIDSHTRMSKSWDTEIIRIYEKSAGIANNSKIILSQFPAPFAKEGDKDIEVNNSTYPHEPMKQKVLWTKSHVFGAERVPFDYENTPEESQTVLAGYIFAPGNIVKEIPYDPLISFFGEELCFTIRAWTRGWRIYSPHKMLVKHYYRRPQNHKIWDTANNAGKKWSRIEYESMMRQADVYNGVDMGIYGAVDLKSLNQYKEFIDLDITTIYNNMLHDRGMRAETQLESEITAEGIKMLSIPCLDGRHSDKKAGCKVANCQCNCHT